ncbi:hybrid sensor histidine kinase/response regulator transcription factor [Wenyingzhuangia sp. IMCC45574]
MRLLLLTLFCLITINTNAQNNEFHFRHLSTLDGLSNNSVISITQDKLGNIWLGTRNGLNKFNGVDFEVFKNDPEDPNSISNNDIFDVFEDSDGFIWVGTYSGLNKYNPKTKTFTRYTRGKDEKSIINNAVICSAEMPNEEIWFGTAGGISIYNKVSETFISIPFKASNKQGIPSRNIMRVFLDSNNQIWLGTNNGLAKYTNRKDNKFKFKRFKSNSNLQDTTFFIQDIIQVSDNILGIATRYNGFLLFDTLKEEYILNPYPEIASNSDVRILEKANDGNIWIGTTHGVMVVTPSKKVYKVSSNKFNSASLSRDHIRSIFKDSNGSIWLGTYTGGVNIWNKENENFVTINNPFLNNNVATSIVLTQKNELYYSTEGGVISKIDKNLSVEEVISISDKDNSRFYSIQTLFITNKDQLWVGLHSHGLFIYDLKTKKRIRNAISKELEAYLKNTGVYVIKEDHTGCIWIGTFGKGLIRYDIKNKSFKVFGLTLGENPHLSTNIFKTIWIDNKDNVWAGGLGSLNMVKFNNNGTHSVEKYNIDTKTGGNIKTIFKDSKGVIWFGTNVKGLKKYTKDGFKKIDLDGVTPVSTIYTILEDSNNNLWLSTNRGIVKYNTEKNESTLFNQEGGNNSHEYFPNSGAVINENKFCFGGGNGVVFFNPRDIVKNYYAPKVILSDLKIKNKTVGINDENKVLTKNISFTKKIKLSHDNSNFSISYAMPSFINSHNNEYAYRLVGLEKNWNYTNKTEVYYTLQNPGTYTFEVRGANNDRIWNKYVTKLVVKVEPAPWRTWWAFTLYGMIILLGLLGLNRIMESKTKLQHKLELEYLESERTKEINMAKLQFFTNISHEFRTPLTLILGPLQQILEDYSGSNAMYKKLKVVESSANHLLRLINRLMDFRKFENKQFTIEAAEGNIVKFLNEVFLSFTEYAKAGDYTYSFVCKEEEIQVYYDRYKLERVFYNLISNAFRYTPNGGTIEVVVEKLEDEVSIKVKDSGVGIATEHLDKIFDRFFEVAIHNNPDKKYNQGTGIGLSIAKNIVVLHQGEIGVENNKDKGAVFTVKLKLGRAHLNDSEILENFKKSDDVSQYRVQLNEEKEKITKELTEVALKEKENTILLVEDNASLRKFMKELLKDEYNILEAENGKVAYKKAKEHFPDLIVSDVIMPEMVGTELCAKLKEDIKTSHIPVILLTSRTSLLYKFEGLESGADDYISKPFNLKEFKLKIRNLLKLKKQLSEKFKTEDTIAPNDMVVNSRDEILLKKAFSVVENNISNEDFDVISFASELGISRSLLFTKIKAWTNFTPNEFIREIRLKRAAHLLELNKIKVSQVGYKVGFKRPKYFSQCFQKKYGLTPTQYMDKFSDDSMD